MPSTVPLSRVWLPALLVLTLAACDEPAAQSVSPRPVVQAETVRFAPDVVERSYTGVVRARREADQAFRIGGKIIERLVDVGDTVEAGQVVARLDPEDLDLQVASAQAELAAAQAAVEQAAADENRLRQLADRGNASNADYERRRLALDEARGRLSRAEQDLALARNQRGYATLAASAAGVVTVIEAEAGQVVALGQPVARIAASGELEVAVAIPEGRLDDLHGATAVATLWADSGRRFEAALRELAPEADALARTYHARFSLPDTGGLARLGMTATLTLRKGSGRPVARVPLSAVFDQGSGPAVYVVAAGTDALALRPVDVLRYGATIAVIAGGIAEGDRVVTLGVNKLTPDLAVRVAAVEG